MKGALGRECAPGGNNTVISGSFAVWKLLNEDFFSTCFKCQGSG